MTEAMTPSLEDYIEALYELERQNGEVRLTDIAARLNLSKASVNRAMNALKESCLVTQRPYGALHLTDEGRTRAAEVSLRHHLFLRFLTETLGVSADTAEYDACRMEHAVSTETVARLRDFLQM